MTIPDPAALPQVGHTYRLTTTVDRDPFGSYGPGRLVTVVESSPDMILARLHDLSPGESDDLAEWDGCLQWATVTAEDFPGTVAWFWSECEPVGCDPGNGPGGVDFGEDETTEWEGALADLLGKPRDESDG
jgi:hypothetical protein